MARRKKSNDVGGLWVALPVLLVILLKPILGMLVNVLTLIGLPFCLIFYPVVRRKRDAALENPENQIPDPVRFNWNEEKANINVLSRALEECARNIKEVYSTAQKMEMRRTDASNRRRFDQRQKEATKFNDLLDNLETRISQLESLRSKKRASVLGRIPPWRKAHHAIISAESTCRAAKPSLWIYIGVFLTLLALRPSWVRSLSSFAIEASGSFSVAFGPLALATTASGLSFLLLRLRYRRLLEQSIHVDKVSGWSAIEHEVRHQDRFVGVEQERPSLASTRSDKSADEFDGRARGRALGAGIAKRTLAGLQDQSIRSVATIPKPAASPESE